MNRALWRKSWVEARLLLACCALLLLVFHWLYVWVSSQVKLGALSDFLESLPESFRGLTGMPVRDVATVAGRLALGYLDPVVMVATSVWAIARGTDVVSGEIDRGTMEMLLAQPVRRIQVLLTHAAITVGGAALLGLNCFVGTAAGLVTVTLEHPVSARLFVYPALNVFAMTFFLAGLATLVSSCDRYRWRSVGIMGGFYVISLLLEVLGKMVPWLEWLRYFTFLGAYEPQVMVSQPADALRFSLTYDGVLLGLGLASYIAAAMIFCRRDLPAPI